MQGISYCSSVSASNFFSASQEPSQNIYRDTLSEVVRASDDVNICFKAIRCCLTCTVHWIKISDEFVKVVKYTKVVSSLRGLFAGRKVIYAFHKAFVTDSIVVRIIAVWRITKNTKKVVSSVAWFFKMAKEFGLLSAKQASWTSYSGSIQLPFQLISLAAGGLRLCKIFVIWCELARYQKVLNQSSLEHNPRNCHVIHNYLQRAHERLQKELQISRESQLDRYIKGIEQYLTNDAQEKHQLALERCEHVMQTFRERIKAQIVIEITNVCAKILDLAATIFEASLPSYTLSLSMLSVSVTVIKMARFFYNKQYDRKNLSFLERDIPKQIEEYAESKCIPT